MELRKDPITRSWVIIAEENGYEIPRDPCPLCPGNEALAPHTIFSLPPGSPSWQVRAVPHFHPVYRVEGDPGRRADGIYDVMSSVGAHEIIVESPDHNQQLGQAPQAAVERVLEAYAQRILDLKRDARFKYVSIFKNRGALAGEELTHPHSLLTATTFVPRRILYELRSSRDYFHMKERCVFCDIIHQDELQATRLVETTASYVALCPFASRVPFETWILPRRHHHAFENDYLHTTSQGEFAGLLGRTLRRLEHVSDAYHLVLHTTPNTRAKTEIAEYWKTLADDYHWHVEILPIAQKRAKSYLIKETYYNAVCPEEAAERLRAAPVEVLV